MIRPLKVKHKKSGKEGVIHTAATELKDECNYAVNFSKGKEAAKSTFVYGKDLTIIP